MSDPIEEAILKAAPEGMFGEEQEATPDGLYGEGTHKAVELLDVVTYPKSEHGFGYRIGLKGKIREGYEYTAKFDLERTLVANGHDLEEWQTNRETKKRKFLNDALQAFGFNRAVETAIDTEEQYAVLVDIFKQQLGKVFDMKVVADGKNEFQVGYGEQLNKDGQKGTWTFTPNGYTRVAWIRKSRGAKKVAKETPF